MWPGFDSQTRRHMWVEFVGSLLCTERFFSGCTGFPMASDRMWKKIKDYAEIFGHIMRKNALIMRKFHRIMRKLKQVIKLIIRPVQCIYMLTVNP